MTLPSFGSKVGVGLVCEHDTADYKELYEYLTAMMQRVVLDGYPDKAKQAVVRYEFER